MSGNSQYLSLWQATALVIANIVGTGIFMLPASLAMFGTYGLVGWGLSALGAVALSLSFARLSRIFQGAGGAYIYCREVFGEFIGFQMAWSYWIGTWASNAAIATTFVSYLSLFWPEVQTNLTLAFTISLGAVWLFTFINCLGIKYVGQVQVVALFVKIMPLLFIILLGVGYFDLSTFASHMHVDMLPHNAIWQGMVLTLFSFLGLESATIPAANVRDPQRTIPIATVIGTLLSAVLYIAVAVMLYGLIPRATLVNAAAPLSLGAEILAGKWGAMAITICALASAFFSLNGWILLQAQMPMAAAEDKLMPALFKKTNRRGVPVVGLLISSCLLSGMLYLNYQASLVDQFTRVVIFSTFCVLLPYLYCSVADLVLLLRQRQVTPRLIGALLTTLLSFGYSMMILVGVGADAVFWGIVVVMFGFPVFAWFKGRQSA